MPTQQNGRNGMGFFGIAPQSYGSYFKPVVAPMSDPFGTAGTTNFQIADQLRQNQLEAQNEFQNNDLDDPAVIPALNRLMAAGTIAPSTGKAILSGIRYANPTQRTAVSNGRYTPFSDEGQSAINEMNMIDPTDPSAFQKLGQVVQKYPGASSDPRFTSSFAQVRKDVLGYRGHAPKPTSDDELASLPPHYQAGAAKLLTNLSNFGTNFGNEQSADQVVANRNGILKSVRNLQMIGLSPQRVSAELAFSGLDPNEWMNGTGPSSGYNPSVEEKSTALTQHGIDPKAATPAQWQQSHYWAQGTTMPQQRTQAAASPAPTAGAPAGPSLQGDEFTEGQAPQPVPSSDHDEPEFTGNAPQAPAADPFAQLAQSVQKKQAEQEAVKTKNQQADNAQWEKAKGALLTAHPEIFSEGVGDPQDIERRLQSKIAATDNPSLLDPLASNDLGKEAFTDSSGRKVSVGEVVSALARDPRLAQISQNAPNAPIATLPSGRKFTAGAPIRTQ